MINKAKFAIVFLSVFACSILCTGCGYHFQGSGTILPDDIKTVAIPVVKNDTTESGVSARFTEALRSSFERYGVLRVIDDESSADAILTARVTNINASVRSVTGSTDQALGYDLTMVISAELKRRNGQLLYKNPALKNSKAFAGVGDVVVTGSSAFAQGGIDSQQLAGLQNLEISQGQKRQALDDLIEESTRQLYLDAVAEDF